MVQMTSRAIALLCLTLHNCIGSAISVDKKWSFIGIPCPDREFCGNEGSCTYFPKLQARACNCPDGFEGERCEFISVAASRERESSSLCGANLTIGVVLLIISVISICMLSLVCFLVYQLHRKVHKDRKTSRCPVSRPLLEEMAIRDKEDRKVHSSFVKRFLGLDALSGSNSAVATRRSSAEDHRTMVKTTMSTIPATPPDRQGTQGATRWAQTVRRTILKTEVSVVDQQPEEV